MKDIHQIWGTSRDALVGRRSIKLPYILNLRPKEQLPIERWISAEGKLHTVKRLKDLKTWATKVLAGERKFSLPWIQCKVYKGVLVPKYQIFYSLVDALMSSNWLRIRTLLAYLGQYKIYRPNIGSLKSITQPKEVTLDHHYLEKLLQYVDLPRVPKTVHRPIDGVIKGSAHSLDFGKTETGPMGRLEPQYWRFEPDGYDYAECLGRLSVIPDKGKARVILIGHYNLQIKTKKLADWLRKWLWSLPEIASGNQQKMADFCRSKLSSGWKFASIDQSQATDRLSRTTQIRVLERMGMRKGFLDFLNLHFWYKPKDFGETGDKLKKGWYSNGQPMGLYISFPMFELMHYIIAKFASATTNAEFSICGDDIVFAAPTLKEVQETSVRYIDVIESLGGIINPLKTITGDLAEAIGALFIRVGNTVMETRIPSGSLSTVELSVDSWASDQVNSRSRIGRMIEYSFLSPSTVGRYTYEDRRSFWKWLLTSKTKLMKRSINSLLTDLSREPGQWDVLDGPSDRYAYALREKKVTPLRLTPVSVETLNDAIVTSKIKSLYNKEKIDACC